MKTNTESGFLKVEDNVLRGKLLQLTHEFPIDYIFYHPVKTEQPAHILIVSSKSGHAEVIESRKWLRNNCANSNILFHVIGKKSMKAEYRSGNPFIALYCQQAAIIFQNLQAKECPDTDWQFFKKRFKKYKQGYYHDREILLSEAMRFHELDSLTGMFLSSLTLYEFDIRFLEILYIGHVFTTKNLHQRIKQLTYFIPDIEGVFVKRNGNEYYLVSELEKGKTAAGQGDEIGLNENLYKSIVKAELKLHESVSGRFSELKKQIKPDFSGQKNIAGVPNTISGDENLAQIIEQILKIYPVEEIYLFYQSQNHYTTTYFLLLIGEGLEPAGLNRIQQSVKAKNESKLTVVLIGHSRIWIQTNLFYHQAFFKRIMVLKNRRYQSRKNHPAIHWENPYTSKYPDLEYYYHSSTRVAAQYFVLRNNAENDNTEGLGELFGCAVQRIFRTFVYSKLSYLSNYLPAFNLWKLCVYAEPKLEKVEYLFEKCSEGNFFRELSNYTRFCHRILWLTKKKLLVMDEILRLLLQKLKESCSCIKDMNTGELRTT